MRSTSLTARLLVLALLPCVLFVDCVIGGNSPCKTTAECPGSQICFSGVCLPPKSELLREATPKDASELTRDTPAPSDDARPDETTPGEAKPSDRIAPDGPQTDAPTESRSEITPDVQPTEGGPDAINYGQQRRVGLTAGGGPMSSTGYKLYGSISAGVGAPKAGAMSSPNYRLQAGVIVGATP